jgi:hypothetical protein
LARHSTVEPDQPTRRHVPGRLTAAGFGAATGGLLSGVLDRALAEDGQPSR